MKQFEQILLIMLSVFLRKLCNGTWFLNHLLDTSKHVLIIQITKYHHQFNHEVCEYLMKKEDLPNK
jgi:hypothetical protein